MANEKQNNGEKKPPEKRYEEMTKEELSAEKERLAKELERLNVQDEVKKREDIIKSNLLQIEEKNKILERYEKELKGLEKALALDANDEDSLEAKDDIVKKHARLKTEIVSLEAKNKELQDVVDIINVKLGKVSTLLLAKDHPRLTEIDIPETSTQSDNIKKSFSEVGQKTEEYIQTISKKHGLTYKGLGETGAYTKPNSNEPVITREGGNFKCESLDNKDHFAEMEIAAASLRSPYPSEITIKSTIPGLQSQLEKHFAEQLKAMNITNIKINGKDCGEFVKAEREEHLQPLRMRS